MFNRANNLGTHAIKGNKRPDRTNEKNPNWLGDKASYSSIHKWMVRKLGTPRCCENCGTKEAKIFDWANISGEYSRDFSDWARLCRRCHILIDGGSPEWKFK